MVENSSSKGTVNGTTNVGGLAGYYYAYHDYAGASKTITDYVRKSYSNSNVTGAGDNVGGLIGYQQSSINTTYNTEYVYSYVSECYATGKVETTGKNVGGLVGYMHSYNKTNAGYTHYNYAIIQNSFATGEIIGNTNVGGLIGNAYRQNTYNHSYQNCYLQITNSYAIGKVTSSGEVGGLIGQLANTYYGSTTTTNSYWTPETTMQETSKAGTIKNIQSMLYSTGYISWDMNNIWKIENGTTVAYLKNVNKPESVKKENIVYEAYDILGGGTTQDPYIITTAVQLQNINENLEASYKLGANIDLTGIEWTPIGNSTYQFKGTLDGNGYTISNLSILKDGDNIGLFGYSQGTIKALKLNNFNIKGKSNVGGLVALNNGTVSNSEITNSTIEGTLNYAGGLIRI